MNDFDCRCASVLALALVAGCATTLPVTPSRVQSIRQADQGALLTLKLSAPMTVRAGEPLRVRAVIQNAGDRPTRVIDAGPGRQILLFAETLDGRPVPLTRYGEMLATDRDNAPYFPRHPIILKPGEELAYTIHVNRLYDLSVSGTYMFWAESQVHNPNPPPDLVRIKSAPVTIVFDDQPAEERSTTGEEG